MNYYETHTKFYVGVDCIIFGMINGKLSVLLIKRQFNPGVGQWSLMGGFVDENESVDSAAKRVLKELTGLDEVYMDQLGAFGEPGRDPGERVISIAYYALVGFNEFNQSNLDRHNAQWIAVEELPTLLFDHKAMIESARKKLREKLNSEPVGFNLLPKLFTLTQLQNLYEAILGESIDKRNFRKRIADTTCIEKTSLIDKTGSRRGAALYKFESKYFNTSKFKL